jgi:hypothetical protein
VSQPNLISVAWSLFFVSQPNLINKVGPGNGILLNPFYFLFEVTLDLVSKFCQKTRRKFVQKKDNALYHLELDDIRFLYQHLTKVYSQCLDFQTLFLVQMAKTFLTSIEDRPSFCLLCRKVLSLLSNCYEFLGSNIRVYHLLLYNSSAIPHLASFPAKS